ncbi:MAG: hypothetical protein NVSMB18_28270 [Acetobacteraceae bacterium]
MRAFGLIALLALGGCMARYEFGTQAAGFPPMLVGANTRPADGAPPFARACPPQGSRVAQKGGPDFIYLGASPANPDLCRMRIGADTVEGWYGIWLTSWPGADLAGPALNRLIHGRSGHVEAFDVRMAPGYDFHDFIRNEGIERISLLGKTYEALRLAHYREGFNGNIYRSVATVWKDLPSGMLIYGTYQHIAGTPELDDPLIPTAISPRP